MVAVHAPSQGIQHLLLCGATPEANAASAVLW